MEQAWNCELDPTRSRRIELVDNILFPLLFHFSKELGTRRWDALFALYAGLEEFQSFGQYQERTYHLDSAKYYLEKAIALDPSYGLAHYNLGLVHLASGTYETSREHLLEAVRLLKGNFLQYSALYNYGVAWFQLGQDWAYDYAVKTFQKLIDTEGVPEDIRLLARSSMIVTYAKMAVRKPQRRFELADKVVSEADQMLEKVDQSEVKAEMFCAKGYAYLALMQWKEAKSSFEEALQHNPGHITGLIGLGESYYHLDRHDDAIGALLLDHRLGDAELVHAIAQGGQRLRHREFADALELGFDVLRRRHIAIGEVAEVERDDRHTCSNEGCQCDALPRLASVHAVQRLVVRRLILPVATQPPPHFTAPRREPPPTLTAVRPWRESAEPDEEAQGLQVG